MNFKIFNVVVGSEFASRNFIFFKVVDGKKMFLKESCLTLKFGMMDELFVNSAYPLV